MISNTNPVKVRVALYFTTSDPEERHTGEFSDRLYPTEEEIRSMVMLPLNEAIGLFNWAIQLKVLNAYSNEYMVEIWADNQDDYPWIFDLLRNILKNYRLTPFYKGTVSQLLNKYSVDRD